MDKTGLAGTPLTWVCGNCGSEDCEMTAWVHVNSGELVDCEGPLEDYWCPVCEEHKRHLVQRRSVAPKVHRA